MPDETKNIEPELIRAKTDGVIKGHVRFDGEIPEPATIDGMKFHADKDVCLAGADFEKIRQTWLVRKDKGVANVVVFLKPPAGMKFALPEGLKDRRASLDQPHCAFVPHVVALYPDCGQTLLIENSSKTTHNQ